MYQPHKQPSQNQRSHSGRIRNANKFFNALRALDRTVVEVSMQIYKVPRRERAMMRNSCARRIMCAST